MPYAARVFEILVAGPSDVLDARNEICDAIEVWNHRYSRATGIVVRPLRWETDTSSAFGGDPQSLINDQVGDRVDAVMATFAARLGSATPRAESGTAEEIARFADEGKPVAVFLSRIPQPPNLIDPAQLASLNDYVRSIRDRCLYREYDSLAALRGLVDGHLAALVHRFQAAEPDAEPEQVGGFLPFDPSETDMRVIAAVGRLVVETGQNRTHSLYLPDAPQLAGVSRNDVFESLRVLNRLGLTLKPSDRPEFNRWEVGLTSDGFETWLLNYQPDYDRQRQAIAEAIVTHGIRIRADVSNATGVADIIVQHVLDRWAARNLVLLTDLRGDVRIDRVGAAIQQLALMRQPAQHTERRHDERSQDMESGPKFRTVAEFIGVDVVALSSFGGELGDDVAAAIRVNGHSVLQVVAPSARARWSAEREELFRSEVRRLARTHPLLERTGAVRLVFDPPQTSLEPRDEESGEPVDRA